LYPSMSRGERRGDNDMQFWDAVNLPSLGSRGDDAALIDVFENPLRLRLGLAGRSIAAQLGPDRGGKFLDELEPQGLFDHLEAQCAVLALFRAARLLSAWHAWRRSRHALTIGPSRVGQVRDCMRKKAAERTIGLTDGPAIDKRVT
jgi:hypothetical protein